MEPFYTESDIRTVAELGDGMQPAVIEGRVLTDASAWSQDALSSVAADLHGQSVVAAGDVVQMSVYDVSGSVTQATAERNGVSWSANVRPELAEAIQKDGLDVVVRGRRKTERDGGQRVVTDAEVGRLLVGAAGNSLALDTAATSSSSASAQSEASAAALASVNGEPDEYEREVLRERQRLSSR